MTDAKIVIGWDSLIKRNGKKKANITPHDCTWRYSELEKRGGLSATFTGLPHIREENAYM